MANIMGEAKREATATAFTDLILKQFSNFKLILVALQRVKKSSVE